VRSEDVPVEVGRKIECAFPRLEPALVCAGDEVSRRVDKGGRPLVSLVLSEELETRVEQVAPRECVGARSRELHGRVRERLGERGELRCRPYIRRGARKKRRKKKHEKVGSKERVRTKAESGISSADISVEVVLSSCSRAKVADSCNGMASKDSSRSSSRSKSNVKADMNE
jgi:hypothetical protein